MAELMLIVGFLPGSSRKGKLPLAFGIDLLDLSPELRTQDMLGRQNQPIEFDVILFVCDHNVAVDLCIELVPDRLQPILVVRDERVVSRGRRRSSPYLHAFSAVSEEVVDALDLLLVLDRGYGAVEIDAGRQVDDHVDTFPFRQQPQGFELELNGGLVGDEETESTGR